MRAWWSVVASASAALLLEPTLALAQLGDRITVPLSTPGQPATLRVSLIAGSISVTAYEGKEVIVEPRAREADEWESQAEQQAEEEEREREREERRREREAERREQGRTPLPDPEPVDRTAGLRRIQNRSFGMQVEEHNNEVTVSGPWHNRTIDLDIKVPVGTSVQAATVNDGDIVIRNTRGEIEAQNTNGRVTLTRVSGPVVAHALNGDVVASIVGPVASRPTSLSSMNGDIDLTLPADTKATIFIRADNGDIYTDFDVDFKARRIVDEDNTGKKGNKHKSEQSYETGMSGTLNGGGAEIRLTTFNGSVYIRKAK